MRTTQICGRYGPAVLAAAALPLSLAAPAAAVDGGPSGISVTSSGSTVQVSTAACPSGGNASLSSGQGNFTQGRQMALAGGAGSQTASWSNTSAGTYTVNVVCNDGRTAGTRTVTVTGSPVTSSTSLPSNGLPPNNLQPNNPPPNNPPQNSLPSNSLPANGVRGGVGGGWEDYGRLTAAAGGALVASAVAVTVWYLRRRAEKGT